MLLPIFDDDEDTEDEWELRGLVILPASLPGFGNWTFGTAFGTSLFLVLGLFFLLCFEDEDELDEEVLLAE